MHEFISIINYIKVEVIFIKPGRFVTSNEIDQIKIDLNFESRQCVHVIPSSKLHLIIYFFAVKDFEI